MEKFWLFLAGSFFANGIPHFIHGISGENFHNPFFYRFLSKIPSPLFNVIWGLLSFGLAILLFSVNGKINFGFNGDTCLLASGFVFASVMLAVFFHKGGWRE